MTEPLGEDAALRLRRAFDESFARAPETELAAFESFLGVTLKGAPHALRVSEVSALLTDRAVVPLPTAVASFLGLTTHRGAVIPVYDLGSMLGFGVSSAQRWIVLAKRGETTAGFAFEQFDGHYRVPLRELRESSPVSGHVSFVEGVPDGRPVISLASLLDAVLRIPSYDVMKGEVTP